MMFDLRRTPLVALIAPLAVLLAALSGCSSDSPSEELCPSGTVRVGNVCLRPDGGGTSPDATTPGEDGGVTPGEDGSVAPDAGTPGEDGSVAPDATSPDSGIPTASLSQTALDFGRIVVGTSKQLDVTVENDTRDAIRIRTGLLSGAGASDFGVTASSTITANGILLGAGERVRFTFTFTPRATGARSATLDLSLCESGCDARLTLTGTALADAIECTPSALDFGAVSPNACTMQTLTCANASTETAVVHDWALDPSSAPAFLLAAGAVETTLAPADTLAIDVMYCPTALGADAGALALQVDNPDPARTTLTTPLSGMGGGPQLSCADSTLDFRLVAVGQARTRTLTCTNAGNEVLTVLGAAVNAGPDVSVSAPGTSTVAPGGRYEVSVTWTPAAAATLAATLTISTADIDTPTLDVALVGEAVDSTGCTLVFEPAALEFGAVRIGERVVQTALLENTGTGPCVVSAPVVTGDTAQFAIDGTLLSWLVPAGLSNHVVLEFTPSAAGPASATYELSTSDALSPTLTLPLSGTGVDLNYPLFVDPPTVDFGWMVGGCTNASERTITLRNFGNTPLTATITLETAFGSAFSLDPASPATIDLAPGAFGSVRTRFLPPANGLYNARYRIEATGLAPVIVHASGVADVNAHNSAYFAGTAGQRLDVLLVVDDSGSMAEEQARLQVAAQVLLDRGALAGTDYHIGVTTTDPGPNPVPGRLRGSPAYVTAATPNALQVLQNAIGAGTNGAGTEEGLYTATEAATNPTLLANTNAGFFRPDAELAVIVISDEDDQSPASVASYVSSLRARPIGVAGSLRLFGITGGPGGCATAQAEARYSEAAALTGGFVRSICDPDYAPILTEIADAIFDGGRTTFSIGSTPAPGSVTVTVDGTLVAATSTTGAQVWGVDYTHGRVVFTGSYAPAPTATVEIGFDALCISATCGDGAVQVPEGCDDGNAVGTDACTNACYAASCGDGFVQAGVEQCDDGNTLAGDGCNAGCIIEGCGNGILEPGEECDDGQNNSDTTPDACRSNCVRAACHDGVVDTGELCDDGNLVDTDACVGACLQAVCGDGFVQAGVEQCDDGNAVNNDACSNLCRFTAPSFTVTTVPSSPLTPAAGTNIVWAGNADDGTAMIPIGFPFSFLGTAVTNVWAVSNGLVAFFGATTAYNNQSLPTPATPNGLVAWWWDDLNFTAGPAFTPIARTAISGTAPNRVRTLTFLNVPRYGSAAGATTVNAEVRLYETTNVIEVHYGAVTGTGTTFSASAGWESATGVQGANVLGCTTDCTTAQWPTDTIYRYTP